MVKRGEVWWVSLDPTVGSEIRKTRPCLVVSPDTMIRGLRTVMVAPMTSRGRRTSFRQPVSFRGTEGLVLLDQIRTVDKQRLVRQMGSVDDQTLSAALSMLRWIFTD